MPINQAALAKVREAKMNGESFAKVALHIGGLLELTGAAESNLTFDYQHDDIEVEPGDLIPFITIGLRQATIPIAKVKFEAEEEAK